MRPGSAMQEAIRSGPIRGTLLRLAGPVFVSMLLHTLFTLVNAMWVGRLGSAQLAAVTTAIFATWTLIGLAEMIAVGLVALAARQVGAGRPEEADRVSAQGVLLAVGLSALLALTAPVAPSALFRLLGTAPEVAADGAAYLRLLLYGSLPAFLMITFEAVLRARGDTRTPMRITAAAVGMNLLLDPFLIFGWGPAPRLGVSGAATATILSQALGAALFLRHLGRGRGRPALFLAGRRPDPAVWLRILRIGAPPFLSSMLYSTVYLFLSRVASQLGTGPLAILGVGNRLESFSWLTASSLAAAASTMVAQNLGGESVERARRTAASGALLGAALAGAVGLTFFLAGPWIFQAFTTDPSVRRDGGEYLRVLALCQPLMGMEIVLAGAFAGAGYTAVPTAISVGVNVLRIPLAFLVALTLGRGLTGLVWMLTVSCGLRGLLMLLIHRRGRWPHARI